MHDIIHIGALDYKLCTDVPSKLTGDRWFGQIGWTTNEIVLRDDLPPTQRWATLWHEVVHGILHQRGADDLEETLVDTLAYGIIGVLKDNPWLAKAEDDAQEQV